MPTDKPLVKPKRDKTMTYATIQQLIAILPPSLKVDVYLTLAVVAV
jgi:hypothetical protein